ncbi:hypothetical protein HDU83_002279 [Entophlyctis luteolus]|nr:hypothetical protein HDU83_002279 [Entophlyctis luteolus]
MAFAGARGPGVRLPAEVNRILFVRNLPFKISAEEMYDLFGKYGPIRQIRMGNAQDTKGTAFVVYEDIMDAKAACDHLSGFNIMGESAVANVHSNSNTISIPPGRYLIVLYFSPAKQTKKTDLASKVSPFTQF